ncbi:hypothetical protein HYS99_01020 [Candidatus Giovannonibacteria bacterium]|nr:hypothetical protein [Candidatus Giovannonibacteria bacterium]
MQVNKRHKLILMYHIIVAKKIIVGIDEVGSGPLAWPVTVAAIAATENFNFQFPISKRGLRDSKNYLINNVTNG